MRNLTATICLAVALLLGSAGVSWSQDYQKGLAAYKSGDYATALREWKPLAKQRDADVQFNLSFMYDHGEGIPRDYKTAVKWYRLAAVQSYASAQSNLGLMYDNGRGVPQDYMTAVKWYRLAAEQGDADAQNNLGQMYDNGTGVLQDYVRVNMWFNIAAISGKSRNVSKNRDIIAKRMTPSQLEKAQDLARECVRKNYKGY